VERQALSVSVRTRVGATIPDLESEVVALKGDVTCASSSSNDVLGGRVSGAAFTTRGSAQPRSRARVTVWVTARRTMTGQTGTPMDARPAWAGSPPSPWSGWHGSGQPVCPLCARELRPPARHASSATAWTRADGCCNCRRSLRNEEVSGLRPALKDGPTSIDRCVG
jgi:hypothetical protein